MNINDVVLKSIFFVNNGEIDLLTGTMAPDRFNQLVNRDIAIANRNHITLGVVSIKIDLHKFIGENANLEADELISKLSFEIKKLFRDSDCICRVSRLGFWVFLNGQQTITDNWLTNRRTQEIPQHVEFGICNWREGESQSSWYQRIDQLHFDYKG
jgi:GGDEF domain-containing protein